MGERRCGISEFLPAIFKHPEKNLLICRKKEKENVGGLKKKPHLDERKSVNESVHIYKKAILYILPTLCCILWKIMAISVFQADAEFSTKRKFSIVFEAGKICAKNPCKYLFVIKEFSIIGDDRHINDICIDDRFSGREERVRRGGWGWG